MNTAANGGISAEEKRSLLAARLRQAANETRSLPLSFPQQRLWFLDQLEPNTPLYNMPTLLRLTGDVNIEALQKALDTIVQRHDSLRTRFVCVNENPQQVVDREGAVKIRLVDLSIAPDGDREKQAKQLVHEEVNKPFNLGSDRLLRAMLIRFGTESWLLLTMHHIISDGWSLGIFFRELSALYRAHVQGVTPSLAPLPVQYGDYALWQRERLPAFSRQLDYWKEQLKGNPPVLELASDRPRRPWPTFRGRSRALALGRELSQEAKKYAHRHNSTLFMVLLAAFKALMHRYTQQSDILVASPIAGRDRMETEGLIGFFVNTLVLRTTVDGNANFHELLRRVREVTLGAYAHQDLPFEKLVEELHPERSLNHLPFTKVMFAVQNETLEALEWPGLKVEFMEAESDTAKFEITFIVQESSRGLAARIEYNTDLFNESTIDRVLRNYKTLLESVVAESLKPISALPLLTQEEIQQVQEWNRTGTPYPRNKCVHELFEEQAARTPRSIAVRFGKQSLTYRGLNERANQLARYLKKYGVGSDVPVAVCVGRSVEMAVALLATLKAGGAYVPLDANYPRERLAFMLNDCAAPVLLTQQGLLGNLPRNLAKIICLDTDWELIGRESRENPPNSNTPESLAYVMYTSGSTGTPKGVEVPHRGITRLVLSTNYIRFDSTDRVAQVSNVSFDAATFEVWGALLNGGQLIGITRDVALSPEDFARELKEKGITSMFLTSALFNQLAGEVPGAFETLRTLIVGGEAVDPKWARSVLKDRGPERLVNGYGPTENTTFSCCYLIEQVAEDASNVPIGKPIANSTAYILDPHMNPAPVGVPGELFVGGDGLARGYWNRPELTAERFVADPFSGGEARLYRTGDLARWRADGNIEFLGRIDDQVKIRGFRIEPGEVETILSQHPGVRECVVNVSGNGTGARRLVAYFVPQKSPGPNSSELRGFLQERLPEYMLPAGFVRIGAIPLTPNGKVDRAALPEPDKARPELARKYAAPRDEVETELVKIWENVLAVHPIGIEDKFFDLGGHSLLAVRVIGQIEKCFKKRLRLATIFQAPTIEQLAQIIREEIKESSITAGTSLVEIQSKGTRAPLFFVHGAGGGMFWGYVNLARHLGTDQPVYAFKSRGLDGREEFGSIPEMAAQYLADMRAVQPKGPYSLGGYCFGGNVAFEIARQLEAAGENVAMIALMNCAPPNSRYVRASWTPGWFVRFFRNLFAWATFFLDWSASQRREFFRWKWTMLKKRLSPGKGLRCDLPPVDAGDLVDLSSYSAEQRKLWEAHIRGLLDYHAQAFKGRVHLFRSPVHPLLCSFDADYGWGDYARGGVVITVVPGAHEKILEEPCVAVLAGKLKELLGQTQSNPTPPGQGISPTDAGRSAPHATQPVTPVSAPTVIQAIPRHESRTESPLSHAQQRVWFLNELDSGNAVYQRLFAFRLTGDVNFRRVEEQLEKLIRRQEILRTVFPSEKGKPIARVLPAQKVRVEQTDLRGLSESEQDPAVKELGARLEQSRFRLEQGPLVRAQWVQLKNDESVLLIVLPELIADEGTGRVLLQEICQHETTETDGMVQYGDFATWQRRQGSEGVWEKDVQYWKAKLAQTPALLELPTDHPRPSIQSYRAGTVERRLSQSLVEKLRRCVPTEQKTENERNLETILLAAWNVLLKRHSNRDDLILGLRAGGRRLPETKGLVGNFENFLVLRSDLSGDPTFAELMARVGQNLTEARSHQDLPFEKLVETLQPSRDQSYHPIFQVSFAYRNILEDDGIHAGEVRVVPMELERNTTKQDLELEVLQRGEALTLRILYARDLFESATGQRLLRRLERLLEAIAEQPQAQVSQLRVLTPDEELLLSKEWTATEQPFPLEKSLVDLFEEQVARTPDAVALIHGQTRLTYRQLQDRAACVAGELKALGVGQGALVGICLERTWEMIASILGTLQAGAAYVPMDPAYPHERLAFMLSDAQVRVLVTQQKLRGMQGFEAATALLVENIDWTASAERPEGVRQGARDLAYVIYTSGSTGKPKGVAIEHGNAVAFVYWARGVFSDEELSGVLASTSICFDLSIFEMFVPLSWGGKVILADNALALPSLPAAKEVKLINTVPSAIRELVRAKGVPESVEVVNLAGEPLATALVDQIYEQTATRKVYDLYGPTETTTYSTFTLREAGKPATIGKPLANEQIYLLDSARQLVPIGVPGELFIGGAGVAREYLNRPDLTAEKFIAHPFKAGARVYRTGDLARWRPDGNLEYLGRIDHQVKVRGFRIELGEVETALKKQPSVGEAVVIVREDQPGDKRLVAYLVAAAEQAGLGESLREGLRQRLPDYMVPSAFVFLEALPLTPNGKVDRKVLPAPEQDRTVIAEKFVTPRDEREEQLAAIWREVLGLPQVGVRDNFFELGGHSLLAIQVIARMREVFEVEVPLSSLFDAPMIETLAQALASGRWGKADHGPVLQRFDRKENPPVSFVQERLWFLYQLAPSSSAYNVPAAFRVSGDLDVKALEAALNKVVQRHEALRTTFKSVKGNLTQSISSQLTIKIEVEGLGQPSDSKSEESAVRSLNAEVQKPFDLERGPLIRAKLIQVGPDEHLFVITMHHSVSDGWSLGILMRELQTFYQASQQGLPMPELPEPAVQYADFAAWQRQWMAGERLEREVDYWRKALAGAPAAVELPAKSAGRLGNESKVARREVVLSEAISRVVADVAQREGCTPFIVLMSGLGITLEKWTDQKEMVIGTVVAGRTRVEFENVIGCFMNFIPVRLRIDREQNCGDVLRGVKAAVQESQAHQDCPFEKIVEAVNPERNLNRNPLYNVGLLLQNYAKENMAGLKATPVPVAPSGALLDLRIEAEQTESTIAMTCEYKQDLFDSNAIDEFLKVYEEVLGELGQNRETRVSALQPAFTVRPQTEAKPANAKMQPVVISSTFTAEPVEDAVHHWLSELSLPMRVEFAPFNQVFQQLLDPHSALAKNEEGVNVLLLRLEDWENSGGPANPTKDGEAHLDRTVDEFLGALKERSGRGMAPSLVFFCPHAPASDANAVAREARYTAIERRMAEALTKMGGVYPVTPDELFRLYPVPEYYDANADELGHVPYTPEFFTVLGTMVVRKIAALRFARRKVVVLDCDQTLWAGVCGEDGWQGIRLEPAWKGLQDFMREQHDAGMLLALCSKNNPEDVREVFERRCEMPLRLEHFAALRLNWQPKSANLKEIAAELNLGLDSIIFVDDNPVECAEVEANCPDVLVLQLPEEAGIPAFLKHCWAFDHLKVTAEDRRRTEMYLEGHRREQARSQSKGLLDFIGGLNLKIDIHSIAPDEIARISQLTQRTNQFNCTTRRRTEAEIQSLHGQAEVKAISVQDRFGDYGLVGVMIYAPQGEMLDVETFLLSCRVLGRGVEHRMLSSLGGEALQRGLKWVDVHYNRSDKNKPALDFLELAGKDFRQPLNGGFIFRFPAETAAGITLADHLPKEEAMPEAGTASLSANRSNGQSAKNRGNSEVRAGSLDRKLRTIAIDFNDAAKIHRAIRQKPGQAAAGHTAGSRAPRTQTEMDLCQAWQELLQIEKVGVRDNFFDLGGHSLLAVRLFAKLQKLTGRKLPLVTIFQAPTIEQLAEVMESSKASHAQSPVMEIQRGNGKPPLFLIHGAGGDVLWGYANLAKCMDPDQPIYGIKSRGQLGMKEFETVEEMAAYYVREIEKHQPRGPYYLGGYCFGGNIAYEMARQLMEAGQPVGMLALLDSAPSNAGYERMKWWRPSFAYRFLRNFYYWSLDFRALQREEQQAFFARKARSLGRKLVRKLRPGTGSREVDLESVVDLNALPEQEHGLWQIHLQALIQHQQKTYGGPVTLFRTRGQALFCSLEEDLNWGGLVRGGVQIVQVPGSHENIFMEPNVKVLAKELGSCLERMQKA